MSELFHAVQALSPEQRALFAARLKAAGLGRLERDQIPRRPDRGLAPLSFAQERLWLLHRLAPDSSAYHMPLALRLTGELDPEALRRAVAAIVARHESLRTTIQETERGPVQLIAPDAATPLPVTDLRSLPEDEREEEAHRLVAQEAGEPFDLARGPLLRLRLLRLADRDQVLQMTLHHIVSDGWSMGILFQELAAAYASLVSGRPLALPELPIQYADFAAWQRERLRSERVQRELDYWKRQLQDAPPGLALPTDRPRPTRSRYRGATSSLVLPPALRGRLERLCRQQNATLFMGLLAAFQALLARWTGQHDVVVGTPVAGRVRAEVEGLIGCFLNTLVLRTDLSGSVSFSGLLARTRETALAAYANQELPFERLVEELQPERSLSYNPVFQVLFQLENTPRRGRRLQGLEMSRFRTGGGSAKFDLSVRVREGPEGLACACSYSTELFERETILHLLEQYRALLEQAVTAPDRRLDGYSLVTERARPLLPDPAAELAAPSYPTVVREFARRAGRAPDRAAVSWGGRTWSYGQLAAVCDRLGATLTAQGLRPGEVAGLSGPPSFALVAAALAVLSAGGALLPIAEDLPALRKRLMVEEGRVRILLQVGGDAAWSRDLVSTPRLELDGGAEPVGGPPEASAARLAPPRLPDTSDPAYVFFTSGTSGTPKAVLGTHRGLSHFLAWQRDAFGIGPDDRCAQLTNISFDVVLRDLFLPLTSGGVLCLPPDPLAPEDVLAWLAREEITLVHAVPSRSQGWLDHPPAGGLPALRWVFLAGEPLTDELAHRWRHVAEGCRIVNLYGPTETTMVKCFHRLPEDIPAGVQPVGRSLPHSQALVISAAGQLCGVNEPGEVVVRTPFGTRGYLNAGEEQERRFLPNPFRDDPTDVVYRTGDLGRYRPDGTLLLLARLDDQVKIRGVRVEPDEVSAVLARHPEVRACAVLGRPLEGHAAWLVAYVVPSEGGAPAPAELRRYLAERLPAPLVPSGFVLLDRLPLTPNGKLDRRALPPPDGTDGRAGVVYAAPRTPIESLLAGIWAQVLGRPRVGIHDDFFAIGGHSLLATQVIARLRRDLGVELALRGLFETPTVAGLAVRIAADLLQSDSTERRE